MGGLDVEIPIADIKVGKRHRESVGDVASLANSIRELGLLNPVVIDVHNNLIAGERRLAAAKMLGWTSIPVSVIEGLTDAVKALEAERDENTERVPLTTAELHTLGLEIEALERPKAEARKQATQAKPGEGKVGVPVGVSVSPPESLGRTNDIVAKALGISPASYKRGKAVLKAAETEPEKYGDLIEVMNERGPTPAYEELKRRREAEKPTAQPAQQPQREERNEPTAKPEPAKKREVDSKATEKAHLALNHLRSIHPRDPRRREAFDIVTRWIKSTIKEMQ